MMPSTTHAISRSLWCYLLVESCMPHLQLQSEEIQTDFSPWYKLLTKLRAYLTGELKSDANLMRFHEDFYQWHETLAMGDSLNSDIIQICASATNSAIDSLFDPECNDIELITKAVESIYEEIDAMGGSAKELKAYWQELNSEFWQEVRNIKQRPISTELLTNLKAEVSPFGLEA